MFHLDFGIRMLKQDLDDISLNLMIQAFTFVFGVWAKHVELIFRLVFLPCKPGPNERVCSPGVRCVKFSHFGVENLEQHLELKIDSIMSQHLG